MDDREEARLQKYIAAIDEVEVEDGAVKLTLNTPLTEAEVAEIKRWLAAGAAETARTGVRRPGGFGKR